MGTQDLQENDSRARGFGRRGWGHRKTVGSRILAYVHRCANKNHLAKASLHRFPQLPDDNKRRFTVATFVRVGASTPNNTPIWVVGLLSKTDMEIPGKSPASRTKFKRDLFLHVVEATDGHAAANASTLGFVVLGDMNLEIGEVADALAYCHGVTHEKLDIIVAGVPCGSHVGVEFFWGVGGKSVVSLWHVFDMCVASMWQTRGQK